MLPRRVARRPEALLRSTTRNPTQPHRLPAHALLRATAPPRPLPPSRPSSSSSRWRTRQSRDPYTAAARLTALKSRAAFKLLEIDAKHRLFRAGATVVDLGYAPGSWSQVAVSKTQPGGRVVGIDVIPASPPRGVSTLQGDFLSAGIRGEVVRFVREGVLSGGGSEDEGGGLARASEREVAGSRGRRAQDAAEGRVVDVVLSDMCAPWPLVTSTWIRSVSNPHRRMMNTSGVPFRDHAGSMDLCNAALTFCFDTLVTGGHFLCKFYQGAEDHALELRLKKVFEKVHRIKPESSRKESKESYFVCLRRRVGAAREEVVVENG